MVRSIDGVLTAAQGVLDKDYGLNGTAEGFSPRKTFRQVTYDCLSSLSHTWKNFSNRSFVKVS